ncbi:uncharacterized protein A1O9_12323, partial [Exophiala aquamarina CBS 119918]
PECSAELKALVRQHESRKNTWEAERASSDKFTKQAIAEKDLELKNLKLDKDFEADGRRRWQDRATLVESKIVRAQHLLILVDGNNHFFKDTFLRAGAAGVKDAVPPFLDQVRQFARDQHKHDLLENTIPIVHVFSDIDRLSQDLQSAGALPDPSSLLDFCQELCKAQPYFTISDCSMDPQAAAMKVEKFYELYVENCHCRHIFLALGPDSAYYKTLQMYNDDPYTKGKTSLVRPDQGFAGVDLSYHTVEFSTLCSIPPSTNGGAKENNSHVERQPVSAHRYPSGASALTPLVDLHIPDSSHQRHDVTETNGDFQAQEVVKVAPTTHSSSSSNNAMEQTWETKFSEHGYTPQPILGDWGEEVDTHPPSFQRPNTNGRGSPGARGRYTGPSNNSWRRPEISSNGSGTLRRTPAHFHGSWDELIPGEEPKPGASHQKNQSMTSSKTSNEMPPASRLTAASFRRQMVEVDEPNPTARPIWSPVAVNKSNQRIDLNIPKPSPRDTQNFSIRTQQQKLCNDFHLHGSCDNPRCLYDHEPVDDGVYLALRIKARGIPCAAGPDCRKHNCYAGHHCPNVGNLTSCGRMKCPFKVLGMHDVKDLIVADTI